MSTSLAPAKSGGIFGREPATVIAAVASILALVVGFAPDWLSVEQAGAITAFLAAASAVWMALKVRPVAPSIFVGVITTGAALAATFGFSLTQAQVGVLTAASIAVMTALVVRPQSTPKSDPRTIDGVVVAGDIRTPDVRVSEKDGYTTGISYPASDTSTTGL